MIKTEVYEKTLFETMYPELPEPKEKKPRKTKKS